jgi:membrane peptidoglycan carboxypeptidase
MVIGTNYIAPLSMATAYAGIANGGVSCTPIAIDSAVDSDGKALPVPKTQCTQAIPKNVAATVTWALEHVMSGGTAVGANPYDGEPIMGKTGTTDYAHENWLVTATPKVAQATWVGLISGATDMHYVYFKGIQGNNVKFSIVKEIQTALNRVYRGGSFAAPDQKLIGTYTPPPAPKPKSTPKHGGGTDTHDNPPAKKGGGSGPNPPSPTG